jgi:hypothetical protein
MGCWIFSYTRDNCFWLWSKGGFKSEKTGEFFRCQNKYSKSLSSAENLNFPPKTVNNLFKFSAQDSDLEYLFWQRKNSSVSSELKPSLIFFKEKNQQKDFTDF